MLTHIRRVNSCKRSSENSDFDFVWREEVKRQTNKKERKDERNIVGNSLRL